MLTQVEQVLIEQDQLNYKNKLAVREIWKELNSNGFIIGGINYDLNFDNL